MSNKISFILKQNPDEVVELGKQLRAAEAAAVEAEAAAVKAAADAKAAADENAAEAAAELDKNEALADLDAAAKAATTAAEAAAEEKAAALKEARNLATKLDEAEEKAKNLEAALEAAKAAEEIKNKELTYEIELLKQNEKDANAKIEALADAKAAAELDKNDALADAEAAAELDKNEALADLEAEAKAAARRIALARMEEARETAAALKEARNLATKLDEAEEKAKILEAALDEAKAAEEIKNKELTDDIELLKQNEKDTNAKIEALEASFKDAEDNEKRLNELYKEAVTAEELAKLAEEDNKKLMKNLTTITEDFLNDKDFEAADKAEEYAQEAQEYAQEVLILIEDLNSKKEQAKIKYRVDVQGELPIYEVEDSFMSSTKLKKLTTIKPENLSIEIEDEKVEIFGYVEKMGDDGISTTYKFLLDTVNYSDYCATNIGIDMADFKNGNSIVKEIYKDDDEDIKIGLIGIISSGNQKYRIFSWGYGNEKLRCELKNHKNSDFIKNDKKIIVSTDDGRKNNDIFGDTEFNLISSTEEKELCKAVDYFKDNKKNCAKILNEEEFQLMESNAAQTLIARKIRERNENIANENAINMFETAEAEAEANDALKKIENCQLLDFYSKNKEDCDKILSEEQRQVMGEELKSKTNATIQLQAYARGKSTRKKEKEKAKAKAIAKAIAKLQAKKRGIDVRRDTCNNNLEYYINNKEYCDKILSEKERETMKKLQEATAAAAAAAAAANQNKSGETDSTDEISDDQRKKEKTDKKYRKLPKKIIKLNLNKL